MNYDSKEIKDFEDYFALMVLIGLTLLSDIAFYTLDSLSIIKISNIYALMFAVSIPAIIVTLFLILKSIFIKNKE